MNVCVVDVSCCVSDGIPPEIDTIVSADGVSLLGSGMLVHGDRVCACALVWVVCVVSGDLVSDELLEDAILTLNGEGVPEKQGTQ